MAKTNKEKLKDKTVDAEKDKTIEDTTKEQKEKDKTVEPGGASVDESEVGGKTLETPTDKETFPIKFIKPFGRYVTGDIAGFPGEECERLVFGLKVAEEIDSEELA